MLCGELQYERKFCKACNAVTAFAIYVQGDGFKISDCCSCAVRKLHEGWRKYQQEVRYAP